MPEADQLTRMSLDQLEEKAREIRRNVLEMVFTVRSGHIGGSFSEAEILAALYYRVLRIRPEDPKWEGRDRFILSKGHAWAQKRLVHMVPGLLGERIFGTHLCDNFGHENLSLAPGVGSLDWTLLLRGLISNGYAGSMDVEIHCPADQTDHRYRAALTFLESHMAAVCDGA